MRTSKWISIALVAALWASAAAAVEPGEVAARLRQVPPTHPRLFLPAGGEVALGGRIAADAAMALARDGLIREADRILTTEPVQRVLIGRRLLDKSRTCLSRMLHLGFAWRLTGDTRYLARARAELTAVAQFSDWNPRHFLDVAEMTTAVAIGYDWFHAEWDEAMRALLRKAILEKGLRPSLEFNAWTRSNNNWNQVCNGGMTVGALAIAESEPELAAQIIARAINTVPVSMHEYGPDGAYPEGPSYWNYGTSFNVIMITAFQSVLGTDFGLIDQPGFLSSADYFLHATGPSGYYFNYSDSGRGGLGLTPALFWFAAHRRDPHLVWREIPKLAQIGEPDARGGRDRTFPLMLLWMSPGMENPPQPPALSWTGRGAVPVAFHRSGWDAGASFVAIKGGSPSANHAHMDVGAFVMDADGVRWADDLGSQSYNSLESKGIKLWDRGQDSDRWKVFRLGTAAHNVLMVDGQNQRVEGMAPLVLAKPGRTVVDVTSVYRGQLAGAYRGAALQSDRSVRVQDEFTTLGNSVSVRWAMVTRADVRIEGPGRATLSQQGRKLGFHVLEPEGVKLRIYPTDPPPASTDEGNEGTRMLGFEIAVPGTHVQRIVVELVPQSVSPIPHPVVPLSGW